MRIQQLSAAVGLVCLITATSLVDADDMNSKLKAGYKVTNLVSDQPGLAPVTDPNLVNAWGLAASPTSPFWVANAGTGTSTLYQADGTPVPLVVEIPAPAGEDESEPTGAVFYGGENFVVSNGTGSGPSRFIFVSEGGAIAGWNPAVDLENAVTAVDNSATAAKYTGATLATDAAGNELLLVANFHDGVVEKYDSGFKLVVSFTDSSLPEGFRPFNVAYIDGRLFVSFALADEEDEDVTGAGLGYVDVFDLDGNLVQSFAAEGTLDAPWGVVQAPDDFGRFAGALLVGNFGDGRINAFDPQTGELMGQLKDRRGDPIEIEGLWSLMFHERPEYRVGNPEHPDRGTRKFDSPALYFTAGPGDETHGLFGYITRAKKPHPHY